MNIDLIQWIAVVFTVGIFIMGTGMCILGVKQELAPGTPGHGLFMIVLGGSFMGLAGITISIAGKLLAEAAALL